MSYRILLTARFTRHLIEMGDYIALDSSSKASRWVSEVEKKVMQLDVFPEAQRYARENERYSIELRQLVFGRGRNKYRVIFTVKSKEVIVLDIRHGARDEHDPDIL